jgi:hypothetical protein
VTVGVKEVPQQSYKLENKKSDLQIELKFGEAAKFFTMEGVSNSPFTDVRLLPSSLPLAAD